MPDRINAGQLIVMVGAAALLVSLFIDWYEPELSAWEVFEVADLILAGLAILALAAVLPMRLPSVGAARTALFDRWLLWIGLAGIAFIVITLVNDPPAARDLELEFGPWLGLIGAVLIAAGGLLSTSRVAIVITPRPSEARTETPAPTPAERVGREGAPTTRPLEDEPPPP
jgi:hypothetical protein